MDITNEDPQTDITLNTIGQALLWMWRGVGFFALLAVISLMAHSYATLPDFEPHTFKLTTSFLIMAMCIGLIIAKLAYTVAFRYQNVTRNQPHSTSHDAQVAFDLVGTALIALFTNYGAIIAIDMLTSAENTMWDSVFITAALGFNTLFVILTSDLRKVIKPDGD